MDEKKQIEEMRKDVESIHRAFLEDDDYDYLDEYISVRLHEKGYRKQSEGKWVKATPYSQEYCNQCGLTPKTIFGKLPPYCPNCGAKMKGGAE